jgi:hypothetical protein
MRLRECLRCEENICTQMLFDHRNKRSDGIECIVVFHLKIIDAWHLLLVDFFPERIPPSTNIFL